MSSRAYIVGEAVLIKAGTQVGLGSLRNDTYAHVDRCEVASNGSPFYGVVFTDRSGRKRHAYATAKELKALS